MSAQYPKDEFDRAGEDMPVGMHRPQPSKWRAVIPFLVILVLVPLLGWGASQLLTSRGIVSSSQSSASQSEQSGQSGSSQSGQSGATPTPSTTPSATPSQTPSSTPSQTPTVDHNVVISVLNGTGQAGLAATKAQQLNDAGYPGTTADNATGWGTAVSTVYYRDPDLEATAQAIAQTLGIQATELNTTDLGNADVVVVIK